MRIKIDAKCIIISTETTQLTLDDVHYEADFQPTEIIDVLIKLKTFLKEQQHPH